MKGETRLEILTDIYNIWDKCFARIKRYGAMIMALCMKKFYKCIVIF